MLLPDLTIAPVAEWAHIPAVTLQTLIESLFRRAKAVIAEIVESTLMPIAMKCDIQHAHMGDGQMSTYYNTD